VADDELKRKRFKRIPTRSPVIILSPPPFAPTHTHTSTTYYTGEKKKRNQKRIEIRSINQQITRHTQTRNLPFFEFDNFENEKKKVC
jgi:hypothetical protein